MAKYLGLSLILGVGVQVMAIPKFPLNEASVEQITAFNMSEAFSVAKDIFPGDARSVCNSYLAAQMPDWVNARVKAVIRGGISFQKLEYFALRENQSRKILGVTGLYALSGSSDVWIGWYGMSEASRGKGFGKALLQWTIEKAGEDGFKTIRLWTTSAPEYEKANKIYSDMGFLRQDTGYLDPDHGDSAFLIYSLALDGKDTTPFNGPITEALLGASDKELARMKKR